MFSHKLWSSCKYLLTKFITLFSEYLWIYFLFVGCKSGPRRMKLCRCDELAPGHYGSCPLTSVEQDNNLERERCPRTGWLIFDLLVIFQLWTNFCELCTKVAKHFFFSLCITFYRNSNFDLARKSVAWAVVWAISGDCWTFFLHEKRLITLPTEWNNHPLDPLITVHKWILIQNSLAANLGLILSFREQREQKEIC
jgi:hypothetical protein